MAPIAQRAHHLILTMVLGVLAAGCNMITGADGLSLAAPDAAAGGGEPAAQPTAGSGGGAGTTVSSSATGTLSGGAPESVSSSTGSGTSAAVEGPVDGASITNVMLYQGVSRPIMGQASSTPVIADRDALLRVFYQVDGNYAGGSVTVRLTVEGHAPLEREVTLSGTSNEANMGSTVNFDVPGNMITPGAAYRVEMVQPSALTSGTNDAAIYPSADGFQSLDVSTVGTLRITLVPVQYDADGSGRMPDTSASQLQAYADAFYAMYPVADVQIDVRAQPLVWSSTVSSGGNGWSSLLNAVADLRSQDNVSFDTYYYGVIAPASSSSAFCSGGCVAGLGFVGGATNDYSHAAVGLGFSGSMAVDTAVHELGHNHGREHAPCGTSGDASYPYGGASIGVYGYNLLTGQLHAPSQFVDMMSYCDPPWISDYTFAAIHDRVKFVNGANIVVPEHLVDASYERVQVHADGTLTPMAPITLRTPPAGEPVPVEADTELGREAVTGQLVRYDHVEGGVLFVPPTQARRAPARGLTVQMHGRAIRL